MLPRPGQVERSWCWRALGFELGDLNFELGNALILREYLPNRIATSMESFNSPRVSVRAIQPTTERI